MELKDLALESPARSMVSLVVLPHVEVVVGMRAIAETISRDAAYCKLVHVVLVVLESEMPESNTFEEDMFVA